MNEAELERIEALDVIVAERLSDVVERHPEWQQVPTEIKEGNRGCPYFCEDDDCFVCPRGYGLCPIRWGWLFASMQKHARTN